MNQTEKSKLYEDFGETAANYFMDSLNNKCAVTPIFIPCSFPQFSTSHQSFMPEQFQAYVELGEHAILRNLKVNPDTHRIEIKKASELLH